MKTTMLITMTALSLCGCAVNDREYWQARQEAIGNLPQDQQAAANIELLRDEHAQDELQRQRIHDIVNSSIN